MQNGKKEITVSARIDCLPEVMALVDTFMEENDIPPKVSIHIDVAVDEIFSNIANYAYGDGEGEATVGIEMLENPAAVELTFKDSGMQFNPLEKSDPDVTLSAEERQIGGLGIYMVKKSMNEVSYESSDGMNILRIKKNI